VLWALMQLHGLAMQHQFLSRLSGDAPPQTWRLPHGGSSTRRPLRCAVRGMRAAPARPRRAMHTLLRNAALHCTTAIVAGCSQMAAPPECAPRTCRMWELGIRTSQQQLASICPLGLAPRRARGGRPSQALAVRRKKNCTPMGPLAAEASLPYPAASSLRVPQADSC